MSHFSRWSLGLLILLAGSGLIARSIVARQNEKAAITQSAASTRGALVLKDSDVVLASPSTVTRTMTISGSIQAVNSVLLKSRVSGEVKTLTAREGDAVQAGHILGTIDAQEYRNRLEQARQQAASAKAQWQIVQRTLETNQGLVAQGFISKNALDASESNASAAKATALAAKAAEDVARQSLDETRLISPINGTVSKRFAQVGERVAPDSRVLEIVDLSNMELQVNLRPQDVAQVQVGTSGQLRVEGVPEPIPAKIARINPSADLSTRAVPVYLSVQRHPALRQGLYAQGWLALAQFDALVVPRSAVRRDALGDYVQVVREGQVRHQIVSLGAEGHAGHDGSSLVIAIASGIAPGEAVLKESLGVLAEGTLVDMAGLASAPASASAR